MSKKINNKMKNILDRVDYLSGYDDVKSFVSNWFRSTSSLNVTEFLYLDDIRFEKLIGKDGDSAVLYGLKKFGTWRFFIRRKEVLSKVLTATEVIEALPNLWKRSNLLRHIATEFMNNSDSAGRIQSDADLDCSSDRHDQADND